MTIDFEKENEIEDLGQRVRAVLGVPEEILTDDTISSPTFVLKANNYINKNIQKYEELDKNLITIAYVYYICYLVCAGMSARLPKQMENVSTKTILQSINWDNKALEMLDICNQTLDEAIEEAGGDLSYGNSFAVLTESSEYPNTNI